MMDGFLMEILGDRITDDWWERTIYGRDLAEVPAFMLKLLGLKIVPDLVARPLTTKETAALMKYASDKGIAVTPRGSGSSAFFNSVPVKGGLVIDLSGLSGIEELNEKEETVTVKAGTRWLDLDKELRAQGWAVKSYPTSAPTATVGGWFNMEGYGVGSLAYGPLKDQLVRIEVVLADGTVKELTRNTIPSISWFAGRDGTLGIVTRLTLSIRHLPETEEHLLLSFREAQALSNAAQELAGETNHPYHLGFYNSTYFYFLNKLGYQLPQNEILEIAYEGKKDKVKAGKEMSEKVAAKFGAEILSPETAAFKWEERFYPMRLKRFGPTLMAAEDWLPLSNLGRYQQSLQQLGQRLSTKFYSYGTIVSADKMTIFTGYRTDARHKLSYLIAMAVTGKLHTLAADFGGHPYSVGFWNTPYLPLVYSKAELAEIKKRKQQLDPKGLLNPGKHYSYPALLPPWLFSLGTNTLSYFQRFAAAEKRE